MTKKPPKFDEKLAHSLELVRKAEKIALAYDKENGFFLAFSGGKDSQALYHVAQLGGVKFKAHFSPTSVDPPQVIKFIRKNYPDVEFLPIKRSIYDVAVENSILPSMRVRWCCKEFKEDAGAGKVTLIGVRHAESARRAKRKEVEISHRKFAGNFEQFEQYRKEKALNPTKRGGKPKTEKPSVANLEAIDSEHITGCISGKDSLLVSPIIDWTEDDVWYFLNEVVKVPHCELYDKGYHRIGCIMCPMSSHKQKLKEMRDFPYVKAKWIEAIKKIRMGGYHKANLPQQPIGGGKKFGHRTNKQDWNSGTAIWLDCQSEQGTLATATSNYQQSTGWGGKKTLSNESSRNRRANYGIWNCKGFRIAHRLTA